MTYRPLMLDLCAGMGGSSQAMMGRGWEVVRVDIDPAYNPDVLADLREFSWSGRRPDLVWSSPPCDEFSREFLPWTRTGQAPDLGLVLASLRVIQETKPRFWAVENVQGAIPWVKPILGEWRAHVGPFFLWGVFPPLKVDGPIPTKQRRNGKARHRRAEVPYALSEAMAVAVEGALRYEA